jgi:hypothetical protein
MNFIMQTFLQNPSLCDEIIALHKNSEHKTAGCIGNEKGDRIVDKEIKDSVDCVFDPNTEEFTKYVEELRGISKQYIDKYPYSGVYANWGLTETMNLQYYVPGGGYKEWHTERTKGTGLIGTRHLAFMTYLNDVTDCGDTEFYHQDLKFQPRKGMTLVWPSDWTYTHRGIPSPSQEKYIITGWFSYLE